MTFKKHKWSKYGSTKRTAELRVRDDDGKIIEQASWELTDKNLERRIFTKFKHRYGVFKKPENDIDSVMSKDMTW